MRTAGGVRGGLWQLGGGPQLYIFITHTPIYVSTYLRNYLRIYVFQFPFGFVQLAPYTQQTTHLAWPELRWRQVASYLLSTM